MMQLLFLGSGSAFTTDRNNYQSNVLIIDDQQNKLLIDCGSDIRFSLHAVNFCCHHITDIYISHLHADHVGGLEYIAFSTKFNSHPQKPRLYLSHDIAEELWENSLSAGLRSLKGRCATIDDYFIMNVINNSENDFYWQNIRFELVKMKHIDNGLYLMPCYGLFFELNGTKIFFTTDTQFYLPYLQPFYDKADLIFHDCELSPYPSRVHAHFNELKQLPLAIKNKMWLYGYQPLTLPDPLEQGFLGFVKRAQSFDFC